MPLAIGLFCVGGLLALSFLGIALASFRFGSRVVYGISLILSAVAFIVVAPQILISASDMTLPLGLPWIGAQFHLDSLAAFFLAVVNLGGCAASLYALGYGEHESAPARILPFFPAFLAGMNLVVLAGDAFTFLVSWEFMSLSSWALVIAHHRSSENVRAGFVYLVMASFGTLCLLLAFGLLAGDSGNYGFAAMRAAGSDSETATLVLFLVLFGAGSKAGLVPLHVWLPLAHPAAPSHVSALMSGVMTKVAVYGFVRVVFDLLGTPEWWWGFAVLALAGGTTIMGVLYALMQHDLKVLLAYHTVENIGIIFIGLGLALAFEANDMSIAAALAATAALLHVLNHSLFKSLLFFGAGAVLNATHERDMERLGGLIHRMPWTSFAFLCGAVAISALPPLNGFVSEWLTFQAIFLSPDIPQWGLRLLIPAVGALLALSAALAAACFVKAFGITFLGRARGPGALQTKETDAFSLSAMFSLVALCIFIGVLPGLAIDWLGPAVAQVAGMSLPQQTALPGWAILPAGTGHSSYSGLLVFLIIAGAASLTVLIIHHTASRSIRRAPPWDCGTPNLTPAMQYTSSSFVQPIRRVFGSVVFQARETIEMPPPGDPSPATMRVQLRDLPWELIYLPLARAVSFTATHLNGLQFLTIRRYLTFVFLTLVLLLLVLATWG